MTNTNWFTEARFGLFIHWGIYAIPGRGEWTLARDEWPPGVYESHRKVFNPREFDPAEWACLARAAGMRYVVFTTRHHDGFCMFDSRYTDYKITNTPYGKDVARMLTDAFRAKGMRIGFYHSLPDWSHPGWFDLESPEYIRRKEIKSVSESNHRAYLELLYNHLDQLTTEYGKLDLLFLDYTSKYKAEEDYYGRDRLLAMIRRNQPGILINDRLSFYKENAPRFDYYTPEICVPNQPQTLNGEEVPWESCATMNGSWGYNAAATRCKPIEALTAGLAGCVAQNGNLLLNIGPQADGKLPAPAVERLLELAEWFRHSGESIHGAGKAESTPPFGGVYTQKGQALYLHLLTEPLGDIILPQLKGRIEAATVLRTGEPAVTVDDWGFELLKPDEQRLRTRSARAGDVIKLILTMI